MKTCDWPECDEFADRDSYSGYCPFHDLWSRKALICKPCDYKMTKMDIFEKIKEAGIEFDNHESDLYVLATPLARQIIKADGRPEELLCDNCLGPDTCRDCGRAADLPSDQHAPGCGIRRVTGK